MRPLEIRSLALGTAALALALALALGCGRSPAQSAPRAPRASLAGGGPPNFLAQIPDAPFQNSYFARRHVWQTFSDTSGNETLEYIESVWSDGQGHFNVTPEHVLQPALPPHSEQVFLLMQKAREGFVFRLRDFRIQQLDTFLQAYTVEDLAQTVDVAGQTCQRLRIREQTPGPSYWEIDVEPKSGLILATREFLQDGTLVSLVETLEFQPNPDLSGITLHQDLPAVPFTPANAQDLLGFVPPQPTFLPQGFACVKSERVVQGTANWARYTYTNGGETLFLLCRREPPVGDGPKDPAGPYTLKIFRAGRWSVVQGNFGLDRIIALGREPESILEQIVKSAVP
jgi:hypothetical protein